MGDLRQPGQRLLWPAGLRYDRRTSGQRGRHLRGEVDRRWLHVELSGEGKRVVPCQVRRQGLDRRGRQPGDQAASVVVGRQGRTGAVVQVGPDGTVYVVWADVVKRDPQIRIAISHDGGKTFPNKDVKVASLATDNPFDDPLPGASFFGGTGLPSFAVGPDGSLYVSWGRRTGEHTVAMVVKSTDKGLTWGTPVVAGDVVGRSEIFQAVTVDPTGTVQLIFNALDDVAVGTPPGGGVVFYDAYWTESTDGGATWGTPLKISSESSDPDASAFNQLRPQFIGDYISAAADSSHVYAVWTDARNGSTCDAIDAYALGEGPKPNVIQQCPVTFGNTDIYLGKIST